MDLAATFLDAAGAAVPAEMDSRSLLPLLGGETRSHRELVLSGLNPWRMIFDGRYKLIRGYDQQEGMPRGSGVPDYRERKDLPPLLFDLESDPLENNNLAERAPAEVERLTDALDGLIGVG